MNAVVLFAGAGGSSLGLREAGFDQVHVEWDPDACNVLRAAFPGDEVLEEDIRTLHVSDYAPDLLWASFPCQCWSTAGKRLGVRDTERNGWPWTLRVIDDCSPRWVICENVPGLTQHDGGAECPGGRPMDCAACYFGGVILPELRQRFAWVGWKMLDAADFGTPQRRRRIFIVAGPEPYRWPQPTHQDPLELIQSDMFGRRHPWRTVREALGLDGLLHTGGIDYADRSDRKTRERPTPTTEPHPTIGGGGNQFLTTGQMSRRAGGRTEPYRKSLDSPAPAVRGHSLKVIGGGHNPNNAEDGNRTYRDLTDEPSTTIAANAAANAGPFLLDRPAMTIQASEVKGTTITPTTGTRRASRHQRMSDVWFDATGKRRLTVLECATLFDMPADWPWSGTKTAQYRQVGNMVAWKVTKALADNIPEAKSEAAK